MRPRLRFAWAGLAAVAAGLALGALIMGYTMLGVKPGRPRPVMTDDARREIALLGERLMRHVDVLGGQIGERHLLRFDALQAAAAYVRREWSAQGFTVVEEPFDAMGRSVANLVVELRGPTGPGAIVLVGAHYDSVIGSPGANDNATGVALLLEMSAALRDVARVRTLRFVAFVNEEPPYFQTALMGSRVHARGARERHEPIAAMIALETLGFYSAAPASQRYPFPLGAFYPGTGDFLAVVGNLAARPLVTDILGYFMEATDFPVEGGAIFGWIPGVGWSDHWSFWQEGYRAVMLTDTALYRYPDYHSAGDRPAKINRVEFARAAHGIIAAVRRLAASP